MAQPTLRGDCGSRACFTLKVLTSTRFFELLLASLDISCARETFRALFAIVTISYNLAQYDPKLHIEAFKVLKLFVALSRTKDFRNIDNIPFVYIVAFYISDREVDNVAQ
jgi:hypothetical protein